MRKKWYLPVTVTALGLGGLTALFLSERGRRAMRWLSQNFQDTPDALLQWNEAAQRELDRIQSALDELSQTLKPTQ